MCTYNNQANFFHVDFCRYMYLFDFTSILECFKVKYMNILNVYNIYLLKHASKVKYCNV